MGGDKQPAHHGGSIETLPALVTNDSLIELPKLADPGTSKNRHSHSICVENKDDPMNRTAPITPATQLLNFIAIEVQKLSNSKRITETAIRELDSKIQMESYLREKK